MAIHLTKRVTAATMAFSIFVLIAGSRAQVPQPLSSVKVTVLDESGAIIPGSEVVFKTDSTIIVSHAGIDGAVRVALPTGQYAVTVSAPAFRETEVPDFRVVAPAFAELKAVLKEGSCPPGPCLIVIPVEVPTVISDLPNVIEAEPSPVPPVQATTKIKKSRSLHCLYLWKCSTS